jgi:phosphatidylserine decarboxylase
MTIVRDGIPVIIAFLVPGILLAALAPIHGISTLTVIGVILILLGLFCSAFFRNPKRVIPDDPNVIVSPADGKVVKVVTVEDDFVGPGKRIDIFLSIFDVHLNRTPCAGRVEFTTYKQGKFASAFTDKASTDNERAEVGIDGDLGRMRIAQIAGLIARRIVCKLQKAEEVDKGQIFGMIRFGSRTELTFADSIEVAVDIGQKVKGGITVVGRKRAGA